MKLNTSLLKLFWFLIISTILNSCDSKVTADCYYKGGNVDFLDSLKCIEDYKALQGLPLTEKYEQVSSIKLVYDLETKKLYFAESKKYPLHYEFCREVLNYHKGLAWFNQLNYSNSPEREYLLANLNYYSSINTYTLEFFNGDKVSPDQIKRMFNTIRNKAPAIAKLLKLLINTHEIDEKSKTLPGIPVINVNDIYSKQIYQTLTKGTTYGYLRIVDKKDFDKYVFNKHDIVVTNTIPNVLPVVSGVITEPFQTPLCHISVLCHNRGTPNAAYRFAFTDENILALENKLVKYSVAADSFTLVDATHEKKKILEAWKRNENRKLVKLAYDIKSNKLLDINKVYASDANVVGGKAANFGELAKVEFAKNKKLPLPEGAFAIPFYYYVNHLKTNGIMGAVDSLIANKDLLNNAKELKKALKGIQKAIKNAPLDPVLINQIKARLTNNGTVYQSYRFRSSTNAEDIKGFNGAGLYASKTVTLGDEKKTIEKAVKQVWASLWEERAFAERAYFNFDQSSVFMGILVHRSFGDELANGVAVTRNLYRKGYPSYTVNVQKGETSVVEPPDSVICDQMIIGLGAITHDDKIYMEYISRSNIAGGKPILDQKQIDELVKYLTAIKTHFYYLQSGGSGILKDDYDDFAVDVEFKVDKYTGKIYIKQARSY